MVLPILAAGGMALGSILVKELPSIASWMFGDKTGKAVDTVTGIAREVLGTDDPQAIEAAIARDPQAALQFKIALIQAEAEARRGEREEIMAYLHDVQSAREQTTRLAETRSPIAYGAVVVSLLVLAGFGIMLALLFTRTVPPEQKDIAFMLLGSLSGMASAVVSYWVGSSRGSDAKNAMIAQITAKGTR
ncbi:MAG: YgzB family protein [Reyranella sp.]|nr:YgzB family protein [Reyranella sp.]